MIAFNSISGALHITPVKGILQLRPGFNYFDKAEENQKKAAAALKADQGKYFEIFCNIYLNNKIQI